LLRAALACFRVCILNLGASPLIIGLVSCLRYSFFFSEPAIIINLGYDNKFQPSKATAHRGRGGGDMSATVDIAAKQAKLPRDLVENFPYTYNTMRLEVHMLE